MNFKECICKCGKIRGKINSTNWSRHLDACKKKGKLMIPIQYLNL